MADFIQHIGNRDVQKQFLSNASESLILGGRFYLSCFNLNIKNYIKGDIQGAYANGSIPYERIHHLELHQLFPQQLSIENIYPMNIFHTPLLDRIARSFPFSGFLGRMTVVTGRKVQ